VSDETAEGGSPPASLQVATEVALVVGEALVDVVHRPDGQVREYPGGSPANVALGLARLDRRARLVTWIGLDRRGRLIRDHLETGGVHLAPGSDGAPRTSTAAAHLDAQGAAEYTFDLDWRVPPAKVGPDVAVLHTGSIAATLPPGADGVAHLMASGSAHATVTYDPNVRPSIMGTGTAVRPRIEHLVGHSDVVKVSDEDLGWLYPDDDPVDVAQQWLSRGPALVVVTRGEQGATGVAANGLVNVPAPEVTVADTVGAGDSYMAGLIDALWQAELLGAARREALDRIPTATLRQAMTHAAAAAAITVSRPGADPPTRTELDSVEAQ